MNEGINIISGKVLDSAIEVSEFQRRGSETQGKYLIMNEEINVVSERVLDCVIKVSEFQGIDGFKRVVNNL